RPTHPRCGCASLRDGIYRADSCRRSALDGEPREGELAGVASDVTEGLLDAQQLVVLRDTLGAGGRAGLDLSAADGDGEIGDGGVLGLAGPVAPHRLVAVAVREGAGVEGGGEGAGLRDLPEQRVRGARGDAVLEARRVGDAQVVADELDPVADLLGERDPALPVVLAERILDGDQRVLAEQLG